jgi:transcriptional regulator GlxA family with amidase domain
VQTRALRGLRAGRSDTVLVAGGDERAVQRAIDDRALRRWLVRAAPTVERFGSVCSGAFVLAMAGLLDKKRVATHWAGCDRLARLKPEVRVDREAIFVEDGRTWTSAGVTTGIDMALAMVERDHGRKLVDEVSARLVLYARRPGFQSQWSAALVAQRSSSDPLAPTLAWARGRLEAELSVESLAKRAGMSVRTLHRRCLESMGTTPARLLAQLRVERAKTLLATTSMSAKEVAAHCGLRDGAQLARLCRRALGVAPLEFRARFAAPAATMAKGARR